MNITRKDIVFFVLRLVPLACFLFVVTDMMGVLFVGDGYEVGLGFRCKVAAALGAFGCVFLLCRKVLRWPVRKMALVGYPLYLLLMLVGGVFTASHQLFGYKVGLAIAPCMAQLFARWGKGWVRSYLRMATRLAGGRIASRKGLAVILGSVALVMVLMGIVYAKRGALHFDMPRLWPKGSEAIIIPPKPNHDPTLSDRRDPYRNYPKLFADLNDKQLVAARANGTPRTLTIEELEGGTYGLHKIATNRLYKVDPLTHSAPYLVPRAADFLSELGEAFQDSLYNRGYDRRHRFIVTSVYRTEDHIKRLRRSGNVNASANSCHQYGTTMDITYVRFDKPESDCANDPKLKQLLMQCVYDMHRAGRCYVKYEVKQSCLHITVR